MTVFTSVTTPGRLLRSWLPVLFLLVMACRKQDIEPEPVGDPVPYNGPVLGLKETLEKSPYTIFRTAWNRANIDARLKKAGTTSFTIIAPTDKAFQDAGWTMDKINQAAPEVLDTLLSYHIGATQIHPASLAELNGNLPIVTLLKSTTIPTFDDSRPYKYVIYAGVYHDSLFVNGKPVSKWGQALESTTATIYPADKVLVKPRQDMLSFLKADNRFSFYLEACRINDSLYEDKNPWDQYLWDMPMLSANALSPGQFTLVVPTNDAFRKSGFNSVEDIRQRCYQALPIGDPDYDENSYYRYPTTAMDSILLPNRMSYVGLDGPYGMREMYPVYFMNELMVNRSVSGLLLRPGSAYSSPPKIYELDFAVTNGNIWVKRLGSSGQRIPLVQTDINVLNGVIHIVNDGLFMP
ncbi:fasciclin domain-containing protein [Chitinophaga flava]|uniref:FAS1 domain-containing protein n=1 Tax=Chitinophaga flava TaxID=2259036 RepID=A0A365XRP5_9BACT|nr:fasciclin domain-containing protein [Chitinophaga flava]RBL89017.1 hypothetical protein DF182_20985 [Chitinophaga flava]